MSEPVFRIPRSGRWDNTGPMQQVPANTVTLLSMPKASMTTTSDEFTEAGFPRWDGTRIWARRPGEMLDVRWTLDILVPRGQRQLVSNVTLGARQAIGSVLGSLLSVTVMGNNVLGSAIADGSSALYIDLLDSIGNIDATGQIVPVNGGLIAAPVSPDGEMMRRHPVSNTYLTGPKVVQNGISLSIRSASPVQARLSGLYIRQMR